MNSNQLTLFAEDFLASRSLPLGSIEARQMTVTSGRKCLESLKLSGPVGCLVKMLLESSIWHSTLCYLTWKVKATKQQRLLFQLAPSVPRTGGTGYGLWRTPQAWNADQGPKSREFYEECLRTGKSAITLIDQVRHNIGKMWPTPNARDWKGASIKRDRLPDATKGRLNPDWVEMLLGLPPHWTEVK